MTTNTLATKDDIKSLLSRDSVKKKFEELLGKKAQGFITSVLQCVSSNDLLSKADPASIYHAASVAATLDLPLNNNLGFAYIVPYNQKQKDGTYKQVAQFQLGYKGFIQLAQRSGQFKTISASPVYEGQIIESNPLTGYKFDFTKKTSDKVIGYAGYFRLLNGFEKIVFSTIEELKSHGLKYSQTFKKGYGLWNDNFDSMATKTVIKLLLSKFAPLSIEMQKAVVTDQAVINDEEAIDVTYADNAEEIPIDKEEERITLMIQDAKSADELELLRKNIATDAQAELFADKMESIKTTKKK